MDVQGTSATPPPGPVSQPQPVIVTPPTGAPALNAPVQTGQPPPSPLGPLGPLGLDYITLNALAQAPFQPAATAPGQPVLKSGGPGGWLPSVAADASENRRVASGGPTVSSPVDDGPPSREITTPPADAEAHASADTAQDEIAEPIGPAGAWSTSLPSAQQAPLGQASSHEVPLSESLSPGSPPPASTWAGLAVLAQQPKEAAQPALPLTADAAPSVANGHAAAPERNEPLQPVPSPVDAKPRVGHDASELHELPQTAEPPLPPQAMPERGVLIVSEEQLASMRDHDAAAVGGTFYGGEPAFRLNPRQPAAGANDDESPPEEEDGERRRNRRNAAWQQVIDARAEQRAVELLPDGKPVKRQENGKKPKGTKRRRS